MTPIINQIEAMTPRSMTINGTTIIFHEQELGRFEFRLFGRLYVCGSLNDARAKASRIYTEEQWRSRVTQQPIIVTPPQINEPGSFPWWGYVAAGVLLALVVVLMSVSK